MTNLEANICIVCGGLLKDCGGYFKCENCDAEFRVNETASQEELDERYEKLGTFWRAESELQFDPPRFDEAE